MSTLPLRSRSNLALPRTADEASLLAAGLGALIELVALALFVGGLLAVAEWVR